VLSAPIFVDVLPGPTVSWVWNHFQKMKGDIRTPKVKSFVAKCKHCMSQIKQGMSKSTSPLIQHLSLKHATIIMEARKKQAE
jgi:hypothetical protein